MNMHRILRTAAAAAMLGVLHVPSSGAQTPVAVPDGTGINYEQEVRPILANRCFGCHGPRQQQSGLRLDLRQNALRGGDYGVVIVPGKSAESKLIQRLIGSDAGLQMPPTGELPAEEIAVLRKWIDAGADMPGRAAEAAAAERPTEVRVQNFFDAIAAHDLATVRRMLAKDKSLARCLRRHARDHGSAARSRRRCQGEQPPQGDGASLGDLGSDEGEAARAAWRGRRRQDR